MVWLITLMITQDVIDSSISCDKHLRYPMRKHAFLITFLLFCYHITCNALAPKVVVTIKPIHGLVASLMQGVGTPVLLLPDNASPHTFQLKPSTLKQLKEADLVIWVGPELELFMEKPLSQLDPQFGIIKLLDLPKLELLPQREGRQWAHHHEHHEEHHEHTHNHHEHHHEQAHTLDPHFWLSTDNAIVVIEALTQTLAKIDKTNASIYKTNASNLKNNIVSLRAKIAQLLQHAHHQPFLVYHDGYQYFEKEFNLNAKGTLMLNPHVPLSGRGFNEIKQLIQANGIACVFRETEFNDSKMAQLLGNLGIAFAELDPLGARVTKGPEAYEKILLGLANTFAQCLNTKHA